MESQAMEFLQQIRVIDPVANTDRPCDVILANGIIQAIGPDLTPPPEAKITVGENLVFGPALVDLYSRSGEPGHESRETLVELAAAAFAGGFRQVNLLPTTEPAIDNSAIVTWLQQHHPNSPVQLKPWGAITIAAAGEQLTELGELALAGITGFADGKPLSNLNLLRRLLEYAQTLNQPIALWPHDRDLAGGGIARDGVEALRYGLASQPIFSETAPLATLIELIAEIGTPVHLMRISTARSVALIRQAKAQGLPITASTTWLHLLHDTSDLASYDPNLRLNPPLGNSTDRQALIDGVQTGVIDAIAIDHCAYTYEEKTVAFGEAPNGALGLAFALPQLWSGLVESGQLSAIELWRALSNQAANCIQQKTSAIEPGTQGYIIFDSSAEWLVDRQSLSTAQNTHLLNQIIRGKVIHTAIN
jgi:dihydroorotase